MMQDSHNKQIESLETILRKCPQQARQEALAIAVGLSKILGNKKGIKVAFDRLQKVPNSRETLLSLRQAAGEILTDRELKAPITLI